MPARSLILKARPTLRGLQVIPEQASPPEVANMVLSWQQVQYSNNSGFWSVRDPDGQPLKTEGRSVLLRVRGSEANRVCQRVQKRHLRQAWDRGTLSVTADLSRDVPGRWSIISMGFLVCLFAAGLIWMAGRSWGFWRSDWFPLMSPGYRRLFWLEMAVSVLTCGLPFFVFALVIRWAILKPNVAWARLRNDHILARLRDGTEVSQEWRALRSCKSSFAVVHLKFDNGPALWLLPSRCSGLLRPALNLAQEKVLGIAAPNEIGISRNEVYRIGLYCLAGAILGGCLVQFVPAAQRPVNGLAAFGIVAASFAFLGGLIAAVALLPPFLAHRCSRWQRHRGRQRVLDRQPRDCRPPG
jgi:hypothetical protein